MSENPNPGPPPKRRLRNYLLDPRFQLKYTGYVVAVTLVVAGILGYLAYEQSHAQTQMLSIGWAMEGQSQEYIEQRAAEYDRNLLLAICGGVAALTIALGVTGILITHRLVGPAYKMKRLFQDVTDGHLRVSGRLRRGDELQDVFRVYEQMIDALRDRQRQHIQLLDAAIGRLRSNEASADALRDLETLKARMEKALE
jgi:nitrogen fixation/metabolism regulation signal transduction histidine kinase